MLIAEPRDTWSVFFSRIVAALALAGGSAIAAVGELREATADAPATRDVPFAVGADCDLTTVAALAARHPDVDQWVVMATSSFSATSGTVEVAVRSGGEWRCQRASQFARFGRNGTRPLLDRRSGDGTTPAGVFPLGRVTAWDGQLFSLFGNLPDPGALAPYRAVHPDDCWGATPGAARYGHLVRLRNCSGADEWLPRFGEVYGHAAVIGANIDPVSGDAPGETPYAAAIFLHRHSFDGAGATKATSGCVSLAQDDLAASIRLLDPRLQPHFAIGPTAWLRDPT